MTTLRARLQRAGLVAPDPPRYRTFTPRPPGPPDPRELPFGPIQLADDWGPEYELWLANKLSITVKGVNQAQVQLARTRPPNPPEWGGAVTLDPGPWSHVGEFGYFRFRNATRGLVAIVQGTAYSE